MSERRFISWAAMFHLLGKVSLAIHRERDCYCSGIRKLYSIGTKSPTTYATYSPRVACMDLILTSALLAMLPIIILFIFAQKYIIRGMVDGAVK